MQYITNNFLIRIQAVLWLFLICTANSYAQVGYLQIIAPEGGPDFVVTINGGEPIQINSGGEVYNEVPIGKYTVVGSAEGFSSFKETTIVRKDQLSTVRLQALLVQSRVRSLTGEDLADVTGLTGTLIVTSSGGRYRVIIPTRERRTDGKWYQASGIMHDNLTPFIVEDLQIGPYVIEAGLPGAERIRANPKDIGILREYGLAAIQTLPHRFGVNVVENDTIHVHIELGGAFVYLEKNGRPQTPDLLFLATNQPVDRAYPAQDELTPGSDTRNALFESSERADPRVYVLVDDSPEQIGQKSAPYQIEGLKRSPISTPLPAFTVQVDAFIQVRIVVNPQGRIVQRFPIRKGDPTLERAVMDALDRWQFNALPKDAPQENQSGIIEFRFTRR